MTSRSVIGKVGSSSRTLAQLGKVEIAPDAIVRKPASSAPDSGGRRSSSASGVHVPGRMPLRESTGNAQAHSFNGGIVACYQSPVTLSPSMQPNIPAPMVPSQSFDCLYRVPTPRQQPPRYQRKPRHVNPLYYWPAFRQYRNRQAHKDTQKDKGGVWRRPELEDAFVDCMLLPFRYSSSGMLTKS